MDATPERVVTVGLIDNDQFVLGAARAWLAPGAPEIQIRNVATGVREYLELGDPDDVVLLDLDLKDDTRFVDNITRLVERGCKVLLVSVHADQRFMIDAITAGASAYLVKSTDPDTVVRAIREIADDDYVLDHDLAFAISRDRRQSRPKLSDMESEVMRLRGRAMPMKVVAERLGISEATANGYLRRAKGKYADAGREFGPLRELQQRLREDGIGI